MHMDCLTQATDKFESMIGIESKNHTNNLIVKMSLLNYLIDLKQFKPIKSNKIHDFGNRCGKNKIKAWKILFIYFEHFGERIKLKWPEMHKNRAKICSKN